MKKSDYRFDHELLKEFIGKKLVKYKHKKFLYTNTVTIIVGLMIDDKSYELCNDYEEVDYFGWDNEATVWQIKEIPWNEILKDMEDICETSVEQKIIGISIVDDYYILRKYGEIEYDWRKTRAFIFKFPNTEIMLEKQDCFFSMKIEIKRGHNLISTVEDGKKILEDFEQTDSQMIEYSREITNYD